MFLYTRCPLRKGLDVLAPKKHANGIEMNLLEMLDEEIDERKIPRYSVDLGANPAARVIPDGDRFEIVISHDLPPNGARAVNYAVVDHSGGVGFLPQDFAGFFVTLRQVINNEQGGVRGYVFEFERDTLNTVIQKRQIFGINGANVLAGRTTAQDVAASNVLCRPSPLLAPVANGGATSRPAALFQWWHVPDSVRVIALITTDEPRKYTENIPIVGAKWLVSEEIHYSGLGGNFGNDITAEEDFISALRIYGYLATSNYLYGLGPQGNWDGTVGPRMKTQKIWIVPTRFLPPLNNLSEKRFFCTWEGTTSDIDDALPNNSFALLPNSYGVQRGTLLAEFPFSETLPNGQLWKSEAGRRDFCDFSVGTPFTRLKCGLNEGSARLDFSISPTGYSITLTAGGVTKEISQDFEAPLFTDLAKELKAQNKTSTAISAIASAGAIIGGVATGNALAVYGGALSAAQLIAKNADAERQPLTIDIENGGAFATLWGQAGSNAGQRGGLYWQCTATANAQALGRYLAAFGERFENTPALNLNDIFVNGTRGFNCLYFKISGGVLDGDVNAEDGAEVLEAFQDGVRLWKDWRKMKLADYGS
jgi:hypothetical protein